MKMGSALAGERHFQAGEWWWSEGKGGGPCTDWPLQGGTLQRSRGGRNCPWKYGFSDGKRVKGNDVVDTEQGLAVGRVWRSLLSWQGTL